MKHVWYVVEHFGNYFTIVWDIIETVHAMDDKLLFWSYFTYWILLFIWFRIIFTYSMPRFRFDLFFIYWMPNLVFQIWSHMGYNVCFWNSFQILDVRGTTFWNLTYWMYLFPKCFRLLNAKLLLLTYFTYWVSNWFLEFVSDIV